MALPFLKRHRDITKELEALFDGTKDRVRGDFIPHEDIESLSGINRTDLALYSRLIHKWKRCMQSTGLWIKAAVPLGTGYKILTLEEQKNHEPLRIQRQAMRRIDKAASCIGCIPSADLDDDGVRFQLARLNQLSELKATHQKQQAAVASWVANPKTLPKVPTKNLS